MHLVVRVSWQAHHGREDAVWAHERVGEVCVLVHLEFATVKGGIPPQVTSQAPVVVADVAAFDLAREVAGSVGVVAHAAQNGRVERELLAVARP